MCNTFYYKNYDNFYSWTLFAVGNGNFFNYVKKKYINFPVL